MNKNSIFPNKIKILGHVYFINASNNALAMRVLEPRGGDPHVGYSHWETATIFIDNRKTKPEQFQIFLHELLHVIHYLVLNGDLLDEEKEEMVVNLFATGLTAVSVDNKGLWTNILAQV